MNSIIIISHVREGKSVRYDGIITENEFLRIKEFSKKLKKPGESDIDNVPLIQDILFHLYEDGAVESNTVNR